MNDLGKQLKKIVEDAGGVWGISLLDVDREEEWNWNEHEVFYAASIIKVPIMIAAFDPNNQVELSSRLKLKREDMVGGSGVLQHMTPGTNLSIYDLITLMIIQSDNTATNMLIDYIGTKQIQQTMNQIGLKKSKFYHKMMTQDVDREGFNEITAYEMSHMLLKLVKGKIISAHACEQMIGILKKQQIRNSLPARIPDVEATNIGAISPWALANKTGNVTQVRHDVGIFYVGKRTLIASVLTKGLDDLQSPDFIAQVGLAIYQYLNKE